VNAGIEILPDCLAIDFVVRASLEAASVNIDYQGSWFIHVSLPEIDHLVGVIAVGNIFVCDRRRGGLLLRLNSEARGVCDQKCGGK